MNLKIISGLVVAYGCGLSSAIAGIKWSTPQITFTGQYTQVDFRRACPGWEQRFAK